jgi:hypothetical protein
MARLRECLELELDGSDVESNGRSNGLDQSALDQQPGCALIRIHRRAVMEALVTIVEGKEFGGARGWTM